MFVCSAPLYSRRSYTKASSGVGVARRDPSDVRISWFYGERRRVVSPFEEAKERETERAHFLCCRKGILYLPKRRSFIETVEHHKLIHIPTATHKLEHVLLICGQALRGSIVNTKDGAIEIGVLLLHDPHGAPQDPSPRHRRRWCKDGRTPPDHGRDGGEE
ncbi:hypothetical protein GW17_00034631 [Ensete ventricosum]|nr:hypothetical protein GW17_00034631 [Ensete ventricosum]